MGYREGKREIHRPDRASEGVFQVGSQINDRPEKNICVGLLAHVDAGKTTLSEAILYETGRIRKLGRVDHKDAYLDTDSMERERGITIFSKQARLSLGDWNVTLLDTPGHVDFSAEMERTLQVLDYAILLISGADGVQAHTETLWRLLKRYQVPTFLFINKMDQPGTDAEALLGELRKKLDGACVNFSTEKDEDFYEECAMCDEDLMEVFLERQEKAENRRAGGSGAGSNAGSKAGANADSAVCSLLTDEELGRAVRERRLFPCFFGSALRNEGVRECLDAISRLMLQTPPRPEFGAKVFKITRDPSGARLTHVKITGGRLSVKDVVSAGGQIAGRAGLSVHGQNAGRVDESGDARIVGKADQIRLYSGTKYELAESVGQGEICALTGLSETKPGQGLGAEPDSDLPVLEPVLNYRVIPYADTNLHTLLADLRQIEEEEPELHVLWSEALQEITVQLMGSVQIDVLKKMVMDRFGIAIECGTGHIVYKETIANAVEGVGHYEPLRHYAEVHLLLEPGEPGSGIQVFSACSEDALDRNWQRLIETHVLECEHPGVLTGSAVTDLRVTLLGGRAHEKHTEGGDFRQATYRAIRHGLMRAESVLLEPWYDFTIEVPADQLGRAMNDIQTRFGTFRTEENDGDLAVLSGTAPAETMQDYAQVLASYSRGKGRFSCRVSGYRPCHNAEEVIEETGYDPELDLDRQTGSVFCSHGAGYYVPWDQVEDYMHLPYLWEGKADGASEDYGGWSEEEILAAAAGQKGTGTAGDASRGARLTKESASGGSRTPGGNTSGGRTSDGDAYRASAALDKELEAIFTRTYGATSRRQALDSYTDYQPGWKKKKASDDYGAGTGSGSKGSAAGTAGGSRDNHHRAKDEAPQETYLLVDGYNIVHAWDELAELSAANLDAARGRLADILCNYQGYKGYIVILVFDAYRVKGGIGQMMDYHNIHIVYTREAETADEYIGKLAHEIAPRHRVLVATSDNLEQLIVMGQGAIRLSAADLRAEIEAAHSAMSESHLRRSTRVGTPVLLREDQEHTGD